LTEIYQKYRTNIIKIKVNYKQFIKDYNTIIALYNEITNLKEINKTDVGVAMNMNKIANNKDLINIKDNIILVE